MLTNTRYRRVIALTLFLSRVALAHESERGRERSGSNTMAMGSGVTPEPVWICALNRVYMTRPFPGGGAIQFPSPV